MTTTEKQIAELHRWYCDRTGLRTRLIFSFARWFEILRSYKYEAEALRADAELIIRHLKKEIARDKRNLGALKLANFLQPDNFDSDLALARLVTKKKRNESGSQETTKLDCVGVEARADEQTRGKIAQELRGFRKSLGKG